MALAEDLERWLRHEPIVARPPLPAERLFKWIRRHPALAALLSVTTVSVLGALVTLAVANTRITRSGQVVQRQAEQERQRVIRMNVAAAVSAMDAGDWFRALLLTAEATRLENGLPDKEQPHRYRYASLLRQTPLLQQMWFHGGAVNSLQFSPDNTLLLTASADKTARIWNVETGEALTPALEHTEGIDRAAFSPDGRRVVTISRQMVRVWDAATGQPLTPPIYLRGYGGHVSFSPDSARILTPNGTNAQVWDAITGNPVGPPVVHDYPVTCVAFSPDGATFATGTGEGGGHAWLWETETGKLLHMMPLGLGARTLDFNSDGTRLAVADGYNQGRIWDTTTGRLLEPFLWMRDHMLNLSFSPDATRLLAPSFDRTAQIWNAENLVPMPYAIQHQDTVSTALWSADNRQIFTASWDHTARLWDARNGQPLSPILPHSTRVHAAALRQQGDLAATGDHDGVVRLWRFETNCGARLELRQTDPVRAALFLPSRNELFSGDMRGVAQVWNQQTGDLVGTLPDWGMVTSAAVSREGNLLAVRAQRGIQIWDTTLQRTVRSWSRDDLGHGATLSENGERMVMGYSNRSARVWSLRTGQAITPPLRHKQELLNIFTFSDDAELVAVACADRTVHVWDIATGKRIGTPFSLPPGQPYLRFNPNKRRLAVTTTVGAGVALAAKPATAQVWDIATGKTIGAAITHDGPIGVLSFSPDSERLVSGSWDTTARVWDATTGAPLTPPMRHGRMINHLALSRDARWLLTASANNHARLWDAATGDPLTLPLLHNDQVFRAAFSPDEAEIITASADHTARVFTVRPMPEPVDMLLTQAQLLASHRVDASGVLVPLDRTTLSNLWQKVKPSHKRL